MKRYIILSLLVSAIVTLSPAQTKTYPVSIGIVGGLTEYNGDLGQGMYTFDNANPFGGLAASLYVTSYFDIAFNTTFGKFGFEENKNVKFSANMWQTNIHGRLNLINSDLHKAVPYLFAGAGFTNYSGYSLKTTEGDEDVPSVNGNGTDMFLPFGAGMRLQLNERFSLNIQETFAYTDHDDRDGEERNTNDAFLMHTLGISYNMASAKDEDKDGVSDRRDKCPGTPAGIGVDENGCPFDKDADGIADYIDACPEIKGMRSAKGCPDADNDSIADKEDKCPDVAGLLSLSGCPDKDGDGITDKEDKCPDAAGPGVMNGCPDADNDGIADGDDECPGEAGKTAMKGCPDADDDGVADKDDKCPTVAGTIESKGCPPADPTELQAIKNVRFDTGKSKIARVYNKELNKVVKFLNDHSDYILSIEGHADNTGEEARNMELSTERANAVMQYLINKNIDASRLRIKGFGESTPAATNENATGRAKNRRVEFKLAY